MLIEQFKQQRLKTKTLQKRDRSPATVNRELQVLSKVFSMAYDNGLVEMNPMRRVHKLREAPARERYLTDEEERRRFRSSRWQTRSPSFDRRRSFADGNAARRNPGLEMGARGLRAEDALRRPYQDGTTTADSDEQSSVEVELRSLRQDTSSDEHVFSYARAGLKLTTFRHAWEGAWRR